MTRQCASGPHPSTAQAATRLGRNREISQILSSANRLSPNRAKFAQNLSFFPSGPPKRPFLGISRPKPFLEPPGGAGWACERPRPPSQTCPGLPRFSPVFPGFPPVYRPGHPRSSPAFPGFSPAYRDRRLRPTPVFFSLEPSDPQPERNGLFFTVLGVFLAEISFFSPKSGFRAKKGAETEISDKKWQIHFSARVVVTNGNGTEFLQSTSGRPVAPKTGRHFPANYGKSSPCSRKTANGIQTEMSTLCSVAEMQLTRQWYFAIATSITPR